MSLLFSSDLNKFKLETPLKTLLHIVDEKQVWKKYAIKVISYLNAPIYTYIGFACQQRVLKTFPGPGYLRFEDGVAWLWHLLVNLYMWLTISSCYGSIPLTLGLIGRDGGLNTLCNSCRFACQQKVLKTFPGPGYLCSEDGVVWLWHLLVNLYIYKFERRPTKKMK